MFKTLSELSQPTRTKIAAALNACLADGVDLYSQIKMAHWNIKGQGFPALHPLFENFASELSGFNDDVAERAVTLGAKALGTVRMAAKASKLPEYDTALTKDLEQLKALLERFGVYLKGIRQTRALADKEGDQETMNLMIEIVTALEKHGWFLNATKGQ